MTVLDDLLALDLSGVVEARGAISVTIDADDLTALVSGGVGQALGPLGDALAALEDVDDPAALLAPLGQALSELLSELDLGDLPVADLLAAVAEAAQLLVGVVGAVAGGDLGAVGSGVAGALRAAGSPLADMAPDALGELSRYRALIDSVERGLPTDPAALAGIALDLLAPGPRGDLISLRGQVRGLLDAAGAVRLRAGATSGLVGALDAVAVAAAAGDGAAVARAIADVQQVRASVLSNLAVDLQRFSADLAGLRVDAVLSTIAGLSGSVRDARDGAIEQIEQWRAQVAEVRGMVERIEPDRIAAEVPRWLDELEVWARAQLDEAVDAQVAQLTAWLRGLLAHLPLRALRAELSAGLSAAALAVQQAGLDVVIRELRGGLDAVEAIIGGADLAGQVRAAIEQVEATIVAAIDAVVDGLDDVRAAVEAVAGDAEQVLAQITEALGAFRAAMDEVVALVDEAGLPAAGRQVAATLGELRATAEQLLSAAPLPEPMKPLIDQLIATLDAIDVEAAVGRPLREAASQLRLPESLAGDVEAGLAAVADAVRSLVPQQLLADLDAAVDDLVATIRAFDPSTLLGDLNGYLTEAAVLVERLDPRPLAAQVAPAFEAVLGAVDAVHPQRLLAPVIDAYTSVLGEAPLPEPATAVRRVGEAVDQAGTTAARAASAPMSALAPEATVAEPGAAATPTPPLPGAEGLRAGDVIRLLGWLPARLRDAVAALDAAAVGAFLAEVDRMSAGLAAELRAVAGVLVALDRRLGEDLDALFAPVATAQVRAQLALQAGVSLDGVDVQVSVAVVGSAGPGPLRSALAADLQRAHDRAERTAGALAGSVAADLERAAGVLERSALARITADVDAFLAALDPEPIAAEVDALVAVAIDRAPALIDALGGTFTDLEVRLRRLLDLADPGRLLQRFLPVLDVLREQLDLVDPRRLADELGQVHAAIRAAIAAYDPAILAEELYDVVEAVAAQIRALDPAALLGDLDGLDAAVGRIDEAIPSEALAGLAGNLAGVGEQLVALDLDALLAAVQQLPEQVAEMVTEVVAVVVAEVRRLLESIRYTRANASASVSVSVSGGVG